MIAAVNGGAYGGDTEIALNCDLVVASQGAKFALPEVKRGVIAAAGGTFGVGRAPSEGFNERLFTAEGIPRLAHLAGHQACLSITVVSPC